MKGPVPTGRVLKRRSPSASYALRGMMHPVRKLAKARSGVGTRCLSRISTVYGSGAEATKFWNVAAVVDFLGSAFLAMVNSTSSDVISTPLGYPLNGWLITPLRSLKLRSIPSGERV